MNTWFTKGRWLLVGSDATSKIYLYQFMVSYRNYMFLQLS
jgi:hypothetical protein